MTKGFQGKSFAIRLVIVIGALFLAAPIRAEELYKCNPDPADPFPVCLALHSSEVSRPAGLVLAGLFTSNYELDNDSFVDLRRNALVIGGVSAVALFGLRAKRQ